MTLISAILVTGLLVSLTLLSTNGSPSTGTKKPTATAFALTPTLPPPQLHVAGQQIVDDRGNPITFIGAASPSLEYSCHGNGHQEVADFMAMKSWGMNIVRLPLSSAFWRNLQGSCPDYKQTVAKVVTNAEVVGLDVLLDLQWNAPLSLAIDAKKGGTQCPIPTELDATFWREVGTAYGYDHRVLFELFSEPYAPNANIWYHGGTVSDNCNNRYDTPITYTGIGMLDLVNAVRATAPDTILLVSGNGWGYDLSMLGPAYPFPDQNIMFSTHPFGHPNYEQVWDWQRAFGNAVDAGYPVFISEFGQYDCGTDYNAQVINYAKLHKLSWVTWAWEDWGCQGPGLLKDWNGEPSDPYGTFIRQQMLSASQ